MVPKARRTVNLPRITKVRLTSFSLYRLKPTIVVDVPAGVFCIAGANGLGKSSFIAAINYGLTGGVAPPSARIEQLAKYDRDARRYSESYFSGRISEIDRGAAEIELEFDVGAVRYRIVRGFFESYQLRELQIYGQSGTLRFSSSDLTSGEELQAVYEENLARDIGLQNYDQYVFLQHFVISFDERRHLLFWDTRASELVLYLALGLDPDLAKQADDLRKAASAAGSLARNAQYQATTARTQIRELSASLAGASSVDRTVIDEYKELLARRDELVQERISLSQQRADNRLEFAEASATLMRARQAYEDAFLRRSAARMHGAHHTLLQNALIDGRCRMCGTVHEETPAPIKSALAAHQCPLCRAELDASTEGYTSNDELQRLDDAVADAGERTASLSKGMKRLELATRANQTALAECEARIAAVEEEHPVQELVSDSDDETMRKQQLDALHAAVEIAMRRKDEQLALRSRALASFEPIRSSLIAAWRDAEIDFVPRFRRLAEGFIGLPLQVQLDEGSGMFGNAHLALSVDSSHRRSSEQLSESQRFFLDIALRMSLAQHMSGEDGTASFYVDTPEGALDIAYEARAGEMFSRFTETGDQLVMTANVNTSQLLRRLALRCGRGGMKLVRMTEWTTLSDVQVEEEELFTEAFEDIEAALDRGPQLLSSTSTQHAR